MKLYHSNNIGNVAVLGHLASGKTSVIEAWQNVLVLLHNLVIFKVEQHYLL